MFAFGTVSAFLLVGSALGATVTPRDLEVRAKAASTCATIAGVISKSSAVYSPGSEGYESGLEYWLSSSLLNSTCVVEPATAKDVSQIIQIIAATKTPFAVKSGGHSTNVGFSSTNGVLISMTRFDKISVDKKAMTVTLGSGSLWDEVYLKLQPYGVNVVGGRTHTVGAGGILLGGGYSWLSNKHGLAIDNIIEIELVLPSGKIVKVSAKENADLFFGLRGGFNNFGIVTTFKLKAYPQGLVYGGRIAFEGDANIKKAADALAQFSEVNTDPDCNIIGDYDTTTGGGKNLQILLFFNGPKPTANNFKMFDGIPSTYHNVTTRTFYNLIQTISVIYDNPEHFRGMQTAVSFTKLTQSLVQKMISEMDYWSGPGAWSNGSRVSVEIEPFTNGVAFGKSSDTAYPHGMYFSPTVLYWNWKDKSSDAIAYTNIVKATKAISDAAIAEGQDLSSIPLYPNYGLPDQPLEQMYMNNVARLRQVKKKHDPHGVMYLTGGYQF